MDLEFDGKAMIAIPPLREDDGSLYRSRCRLPGKTSECT